MALKCSEVQDGITENCDDIKCNSFKNCDDIKCNSFKNCKWYNVPCHIARAACVLAALIAVIACWTARVLCVAAALVLQLACIAAAAVVRVVCEVINLVLIVVGIVFDVIAFIVGLILSIPIIGGIIRTVLNWLTEIFWRIVGLFDFLASLAGIRLRKKMYFGVVVPSVKGVPIASDADIMNQVNAAIQIYDQTCNINMKFTGICHTDIPAPDAGLTVGCDASGFFNDWWLAGSYFEFAAATCKFTNGFRRIMGYGAEIIVFIVQNVTPDKPGNTRGCSFGSTHNYVVVEAGSAVSNFMASHEIGHTCWLSHKSGTNLMNPTVPFANPTLTALQIATVRGSKHCVYI